MHDYTVTDPHCISDPDFYKNDCGSPPWAYGLFYSWNILSMYIFASMVLSNSSASNSSFSPLCTKTFHMSISGLASFGFSLVRKLEDLKRSGPNLTKKRLVILRKSSSQDSSLYGSQSYVANISNSVVFLKSEYTTNTTLFRPYSSNVSTKMIQGRRLRIHMTYPILICNSFEIPLTGCLSPKFVSGGAISIFSTRKQ